MLFIVCGCTILQYAPELHGVFDLRRVAVSLFSAVHESVVSAAAAHVARNTRLANRDVG